MSGMYVLAHPLTEAVSTSLPVSPAVVATIGAGIVAGIARLAEPAGAGPTAQLATPSRPWAQVDPLPATMWLTRLAGVATLAGVIGIGRFAPADPNSSFSPVVGLPEIALATLFPLLLLSAVVLGDVWGWVDPWDTAARVLTSSEPADDNAADTDVRWALPLAAGWMWYVAAFRSALTDPRALAAAAALYTLVTLAGCLAIGRRRWLARAEPFGLFLSWLGQLRHQRLTSWAPPKGSAAVLGVIAGGLLFAEVRTSSLWGVRDLQPNAAWLAAAGLAACAAVAAAVFAWGERRARRYGAPGSVLAAVVPTSAGIGIALSLTDNRFLGGVESVIRWLGVAWSRPPLALPAMALLLTQVGILVLGATVGGRVAARRSPTPRAFGPAVIVTCVLMGAAVLLVTAA